MQRYSVGGRMNAATAATLDDVAAHLWNPSGTKSIFVAEIHVVKTAATVDHHKLIRSTTAGTTPGATITPDADNAYSRQATPPSGAVLYVANFATEPTLAGPEIARQNLPAAAGAGFAWVFGNGQPGLGIEVPPGTGLAVAVPEVGTEVAIQISDFTFVWDE